ncbi:MAG: hypothetical protein P4L57_01360 [Rhizomicrobium sp.]|nr:hypothetical protein [Rhizomicrobium sp.]
MDAIPELEAAFVMIRKVISQQRDAAAKEAIDRLVSAATGSNSTPSGTSLSPSEGGGKVRAGVAKALVARVMAKFGKSGIAASNIKDYAETEEEHLLSPSTIRLELTRGRDDEPARYKNFDGKWYLA